MKKLIYLICLLVLNCMFFGCGPAAPRAGAPAVAVSILPLKYLVDRISGGDFDVTVIVPPGASPETYEPELRQMKEVAAASAYFQVGLIDFEQAFAKSIKENAPGKQMVNLSEGLDLLEGVCGHQHPHNHRAHGHGVDPHIWLSPIRIRSMASGIGKVLTEIQPDSAEKYRINTAEFISSIDSIHNYNNLLFKNITHRDILIYHPFLTYFAEDYGLVQVAIEQEGKEPSAGQLRGLIENIREKKIDVLFYQEGSYPHTVEALVQEVGLKAVVLDPLAYDWEQNIKEITAQIRESLEYGR